jgi:hypothetical protein
MLRRLAQKEFQHAPGAGGVAALIERSRLTKHVRDGWPAGRRKIKGQTNHGLLD